MVFLEYLSRKRVEHAVSDLILTDDSIISIALKNGFSNSKSFTNSFKKIYNQSPSEYRKNYSNIEKGTEQYQEIILTKENGLLELSKYLKKYDIFTENKCELEEKKEIALDYNIQVPLKKPNKILDISNAKAILKTQTLKFVKLLFKFC